MDVIFSDNHLLVAAKPAGLLTQPTEQVSTSLEEKAKEWVKKEFEKQGNVFLHAIHRLDKGVSGLVVFARTSKALSRLNESMRQRTIRKTYFALIEGALPANEGILENYLVHDEHRSRVVKASAAGAKHATLSYKALQKNDKYSLVEIDLHSGRYHQIRAQFSHAGYPLLGDQKYGSKHPFLDGPHVALHQGKLQFMHPVTQEILTLTCPFPASWEKDFSELLSLAP